MNYIILCSGKAGSGKNTVANIIEEQLKKDYTVQQMSLAEPLKHMCQKSFKPLIDHINNIALEDSGFQQMNNDEMWFEKKNDISRLILQCVGTQLIRNSINRNYWVDIFRDRVNDYFEGGRNRVVICSDARFLNEINIKANDEIRFAGPSEKIFKIRINRGISPSVGSDHESETELDKYTDWDVVIDNSGTIEELKDVVYDVLTTIGMIKV